MTVATIPSLTSNGCVLDTSPASWGELEDSSRFLGNAAALRERMESNGYLLLRDYFPRNLIETARLAALERLQAGGVFNPDYPLSEGVLRSGAGREFPLPDMLAKNEAIRRVVFGPEIIGFYEKFLGGAVRPFDFIWGRAMVTGNGTCPHCDLVYMSRGTRNLYTAWIPYGDLTLETGGLMVLEKSHLQSQRLQNYLNADVDSFCVNKPEWQRSKFNGQLSKNPATLREKLGGRWLGGEFRMGDLLTFRMDLVHASLDNQTDRIRLSTDTRYQLASEPIDERWVGEKPVGHGPGGKRGRVC